MEKIVYIKGCDTAKVNKMLIEGWKVKSIIPFFEKVTSDSDSNRVVYGAYVVLESTIQLDLYLEGII